MIGRTTVMEPQRETGNNVAGYTALRQASFCRLYQVQAAHRQNGGDDRDAVGREG